LAETFVISFIRPIRYGPDRPAGGHGEGGLPMPTTRRDGVAQVYALGQSWSGPPGAHHVLTEPARLLAVFVSDSGAPLKTDDP
jgi:hypothetical protein